MAIPLAFRESQGKPLKSGFVIAPPRYTTSGDNRPHPSIAAGTGVILARGVRQAVGMRMIIAQHVSAPFTLAPQSINQDGGVDLEMAFWVRMNVCCGDHADNLPIPAKQ